MAPLADWRKGRSECLVAASPASRAREVPTLLDYWRRILRHKGLVIACAIAGSITALAVFVSRVPEYAATGTLLVEDVNQNFLDTKDVTPVSEGSNTTASSDIQTHVKRLRAGSLIRKVLQRVGPLPSRRSGYGLSAPPPRNAHSYSEDSIGTAQAHLDVRAFIQTRLVEAQFESADPAYSAAFVNALLEEYIEHDVQDRLARTETTTRVLTEELGKAREQLERAEDALEHYANAHGLLFTGDETNVSENRLLTLTQLYTKARADRLAAQSKNETAARAGAEALPDTFNDEALRDSLRQLTDLRREEARLATLYAPEYPALKQIQAQIRSLEHSAARQRSTILGRIHSAFQEATRHEELLAADYQLQSRQVTDERGQAVGYGILKREVDSKNRVYESMLQRVSEARLASVMRPSRLSMVDPARKPSFPVGPGLALCLSSGLVAGLFLGVGATALLTGMDSTIRRPGDAVARLGIAELGSIPHTTPRPVAGAIWSARTKIDAFVRGDAEPLQTVWASIACATPEKRTLIITSGSAGDGKSTVVSNLAKYLAEVGQRVLVIDADLRRPRLHQIFKVPNDTGLTMLLTAHGRAEPRAVWQGVPDSPGLAVLTSGPCESDSPHLLYEQLPIQRLLDSCKHAFDMVLVDTPPVLSCADARLLARSADGVVLVVRAGRTKCESIAAISRQFTVDGAPVMGVVLNDCRPNVTSALAYY
jgi:capsular exopolysaccharide synthesis family protein